MKILKYGDIIFVWSYQWKKIYCKRNCVQIMEDGMVNTQPNETWTSVSTKFI
jgi:hypothetical protein